MNNKKKFLKIGLFDSGLGGLPFLKFLSDAYPEEKYFYLADTLHLPYGSKKESELKNYCEQIQNFFSSLSVDMIVIACNSASSIYLDQKFYKDIPLQNIILPTAQKAYELSQKKDESKIGILATQVTVESKSYIRCLHSMNPNLKIVQKSVPLLTSFVERGWFSHSLCQKALKEYLEPLMQEGIQVLIPGCTHHLFLFDEIRKIVGPNVEIADPRECLVSQIETISQNFKKHQAPSHSIKKDVEIYITRKTPDFLKICRHILEDSSIEPQLINLN